MSVVFYFVPLAVAVVSTMAVGADSVASLVLEKKLENSDTNETNSIKSIDTSYVDENMLLKTLTEHGIPAKLVTENEIVAELTGGTIVYTRSSSEDAFVMDINDIHDVDELLCSVRAIESEYKTNVQTFSYERVMNHLPENMSLDSEQVLEDDSILITLNVD